MTVRWLERQTNRQTARHAERQIYGITDKQTDGQHVQYNWNDGETDRQDRQTGEKTENNNVQSNRIPGVSYSYLHKHVKFWNCENLFTTLDFAMSEAYCEQLLFCHNSTIKEKTES